MNQARAIKLHGLLLCFLLLPAGPIPASPNPTDRGHDKYGTEAEIPEPMVFDLVRRLGSQRGELEINTLVRYEGSVDPGDIRYAPEIEYAILDGLALELELPMHGHKSESLKVAAQLTFGYMGEVQQMTHGAQLLGERFWRPGSTELTLLYLFGHRLSHGWSYLLMVGPRTASAPDWETTSVLNGTLFYNYSREIDLGLEVNTVGLGLTLEEVRIMPQLHLLFRHDLKIQAGFGLLYDGSRWTSSSGFRLIKEFN